MASKTFSFNKTVFHYDEMGQGDALVFVHAGICDRRMWQPQLTQFANHFHTFAYDQRGFGETAVADTTYSHLEDLNALFNHWQLKQAHLVGCSKGGTLSMDFALAHPNKVKSLTMVCSNPSGFQFEGEVPPQWEEMVAAFEADDIEKGNELEIQFWVDGWQHRQPNSAPEAVRELVRDMNRIALQNGLKELGEERPLTTKAVDQIEQLNVPILLIDGKYDDDDLGKALDFIKQHHPTAQKIILEAGHLPNLEQPEKFNQLLLSFLQGLY